MPSINHPDNFHGRVNLAALYISQGRSTSRTLDHCFQNDDGDAVLTALYRRAQARPESDLARNLWRYIRREKCEPLAIANAHRKNLAAWSRELRAPYKAPEPPPAFRSELTPTGEQLVIPGCEKNAAPGTRQLDLF